MYLYNNLTELICTCMY